MTVALLTAHGRLTLGEPSPSAFGCAFCAKPAQMLVDSPTRTVAACAECIEDAIVTAAMLVGIGEPE